MSLDEALSRLAAVEPQAADLLGLSLRGAHRLWAYAKAWLLQELERE